MLVAEHNPAQFAAPCFAPGGVAVAAVLVLLLGVVVVVAAAAAQLHVVADIELYLLKQLYFEANKPFSSLQRKWKNLKSQIESTTTWEDGH